MQVEAPPNGISALIRGTPASALVLSRVRGEAQCVTRLESWGLWILLFIDIYWGS